MTDRNDRCDVCTTEIPQGTSYTTVELMREHRSGNVITPEHADQLLTTCTGCTPTAARLATLLRGHTDHGHARTARRRLPLPRRARSR